MALSDLSSPSAVRAAIKECDRLGRERFLELYGFAPAREYLLLFEGRKYDSKAIAGVAHKYEFPEQGALSSDAFSGGISAGAAAKQLNLLGFEIVGIKHKPSDWTLRECEVTVDGYFDCLMAQLKGAKTNKTAVYRRLSDKLNRRSAKAVEYKFQNINAILVKDGLPALGLPLRNLQSLLTAVVHNYLRNHPHVFDSVLDSPPVPRSAKEIFVPPPAPPKRGRGSEATGRAKAGGIDWAQQDAENKRLGEHGEGWVFECEKKRLGDAGRPELAERVQWASKEIGDGLGYDIASFSSEGDTIFIEVKTTNGGPTRPFYISEGELRVADREGERYRLYRVFNFAIDPKIFVLTSPLRKRLALKPTSYRAVVGHE